MQRGSRMARVLPLSLQNMENSFRGFQIIIVLKAVGIYLALSVMDRMIALSPSAGAVLACGATAVDTISRGPETKVQPSSRIKVYPAENPLRSRFSVER